MLARLGTGDPPRGIVRPAAPSLEAIPEWDAGFVEPDRPFAYYETSRGCPGSCGFCQSGGGGALRRKDLRRVERELAAIAGSGFRGELRFLDRTANERDDRFAALLALLSRFAGSFERCQFEVDPRLLSAAQGEALRAHGAPPVRLEIGLQTAVDAENRAVGRVQDSAAALERIGALVRGGVECHIDLLAGLPGQTMASARASLDAALALAPHSVQLWPLKVLPGTPLSRRAAALRLAHDPHPPYAVRATPHLGAAEMEELSRAGRALNPLWNHGPFRAAFRALADRSSPSAALLALAPACAPHPGRPGASPADLARALLDAAQGDPRVVARTAHAWRLSLGKRARPVDPRLPRGTVPALLARGAEIVRLPADPEGEGGAVCAVYHYGARMAGRAGWWAILRGEECAPGGVPIEAALDRAPLPAHPVFERLRALAALGPPGGS